MTDFLNAVNTEAESITADFITGIEFQGFNIDAIRSKAQDVIGDPRLTIELAIIGAMRGNRPKDMDNIRLSNGQSLGQYLGAQSRAGTFHVDGEGGPKGRLTLARLSQAFAEAVIVTLMRIHQDRPLTKRFPGNRLPPYLEFMGAGSLTMPDALRAEHKRFAQEFSEALSQVGGSFDETLYTRMSTAATDPTGLQMRNIPLI
jgi:hypothetical protein